MTNFLIKISLSILLISVTVTPVSAQSNQTQEAIGTLGNLFGALAQAGAKSKAKKGWAKISEPVKACVNMTLASRNLTVDQIVAAGVTPTNQQVAPLITFCDQILVAQLQTNVACNVSNSKGQQVVSTCNQVFAKDENGTITEISRDDFIRAAGNGEKVQIGIFETSVANAARLNEERRLAEAERQAFLDSPEGKRQAAATAARAKAVAAAEAGNKARQAAAAALAPRGYHVTCSGYGDSRKYNLYSVACKTRNDVLIGFRWAIDKLQADKSRLRNYSYQMSIECTKSMNQYLDLPSQHYTNKEIIMGSFAPCNAGLHEMQGPGLR